MKKILCLSVLLLAMGLKAERGDSDWCKAVEAVAHYTEVVQGMIETINPELKEQFKDEIKEARKEIEKKFKNYCPKLSEDLD